MPNSGGPRFSEFPISGHIRGIRTLSRLNESRWETVLVLIMFDDFPQTLGGLRFGIKHIPAFDTGHASALSGRVRSVSIREASGDISKYLAKD